MVDSKKQDSYRKQRMVVKNQMMASGDSQVVAIIPAAGVGRRMGGQTPKLLRKLAGQEILIRTLKALNIPEIEAFFISVSLPLKEEISRLVREAFTEREIFLSDGGKERQDSVFNCLSAASDWSGWRVPPERRIVLIHDAARPLVDEEVLRQVIREASVTGASGVGVPVKDTIKVVGGDLMVKETPDRTCLWAIQTPQAFSFPVIWEAHLRARADSFMGTDDCSLVERSGYPVRMVEGSYRNIKITTPEDTRIAAVFLEEGGTETMLRVGQGYDVHRLLTGRRLVLAGVEIPGELGLSGHSDADVAIHAVMDALLGAAGMGDIGELFPDKDPQYQGIDSRILLGRVVRRLRQAKIIPINLDLTIIAGYPKIAPYRDRMRDNMAEILGLPRTEVNIKATTTEGLGFTGRGEGIASQAVILVRKLA